MHRSKRFVLLGAAVALGAVGASSATAQTTPVPFLETFDGVPLGLARNTGSAIGVFQVTNDNVDVIGPGLFDIEAGTGHGNYVDLTGTTPTGDTTPSAGEIRTNLTGLTVGQLYSVRFDIANSGGPGANNASVTIGLFGNNYNFAALSGVTGFVTQTVNFVATATSSFLTFSSVVSSPNPPGTPFPADNDNFGVLLDNVSVTAVPVPPALFGGAGLLGLVGAARTLRRRSAVI